MYKFRIYKNTKGREVCFRELNKNSEFLKSFYVTTFGASTVKLEYAKKNYIETNTFTHISKKKYGIEGFYDEFPENTIIDLEFLTEEKVSTKPKYVLGYKHSKNSSIIRIPDSISTKYIYLDLLKNNLILYFNSIPNGYKNIKVEVDKSIIDNRTKGVWDKKQINNFKFETNNNENSKTITNTVSGAERPRDSKESLRGHRIYNQRDFNTFPEEVKELKSRFRKGTNSMQYPCGNSELLKAIGSDR